MRLVASRVKARVDVQGWGLQVIVVNKGSYKANVAESNRLQATEHLALHSNAGGGHGTELFYRTFSRKGKAFATALYPFVASASNLPDRGVKSSLGYGELNGPRATAVIVEFAYHDNKAEAQEIRTSVNEYAEAIVKGLARYYGKTYHEVAAPPVTPPTPALPAAMRLKKGSRGNGVKTLQNALGIYPNDGIFGAGTDKIVREWEADNRHFKSDGVVDDLEFKAITDPPFMRQGVTHPVEWVKVVQRMVDVKDDGSWGPKTHAAIEKEQKAHKVKVDGRVVDAATWAALKKRSK